MRTSETCKTGGRAGRAFRFGPFAALLIAAALACGCSNLFNSGSTTPGAYASDLYMTEFANGHVYTFNPSTNTGSSSSLVTTAANAGEIKFYKGIGYVAIGYGTGGVYYFNPSGSAPSATLIPGSAGLDAQYFAFYNATTAYVSTYGQGLYTFNPSSPGSGISSSPINGTNTLTLQEVIVGPDNMIYVADNGDGAVLRINPTNNSISATITTNATGTTGLFSGVFSSNPGVFVANTAGSIDFVPENASNNSKATLVTSSIAPERLIQLANGNLVATGYVYNSSTNNTIYHTYLVTLSGATATYKELTPGSPFGSGSIAYSNGLVYVPSATSNQIYIFDVSGNQQTYSPVSVMTSKDNLANVAFYQD